ncbi:MAG: glycosyl hydrolase 53 family protein [Firmicutes bacterium]|nr:glycosyl hydrolase 53 family protein [Bacillota bacterium]
MLASVQAAEIEAGNLRVDIESGSCIYDDSNNQIIIQSGGTYSINSIRGTDETSTTIKVTASNDELVYITLENVNIKSNSAPPLEIDCSSNVTIKLSGTNTLDASSSIGYAGLQKTSTDNTLVITSADGDGKTTGTLNATGGGSSAGIGGGDGGAGSNITISGGIVNATGGNYGAGIGGGYFGAGSNITISGGTVTAAGGTYAAGIGGSVRSGEVTIYGGTVSATGGLYAAGIGGGADYAGTVTIYGGAVSAVGGTNAADIGGGRNGDSYVSSSEEITYGTIDACSSMRGMDLSTFYSNWTNGAVYRDYEGNEFSAAKNNAVDFFEFLYNDCGVDWVKLRVWNDPYDEDGNPYGGGNIDVEVAKIIGQWATEAGMTILIDFQYSDFWADADTQLAPKAWADMTIDEKVEALYDYTYDSLEYLLDEGVNVGMVQIGNETNGSFCGETDWDNIVKLFKSGSMAVRDISVKYGMNIKVAFHFAITDDKGTPSYYAELLDEAGVDYDAIGITYYMYSDGTFADLQSEINTITNAYGKKVYIAETAYLYTDENYDNLANEIASFDDFASNAYIYEISEAGQEAALTAILSVLSQTDCTGMFYWEPAWTALDGSTLEKGTGRATTYSKSYTGGNLSDHEGTAFDNQTLFDENGNALPALKFYVDYVDNVGLTRHSWDEGTVTIAATCTESGVKVYTCSDCGQTKIEIIGATGHTPGEAVIENEAAASHTTDGSYDSVVYCTVCGEELSRETITVSAGVHTAGEVAKENSVEATCTTDGSYDSVVYCLECGEEISRETVITVSATGHSYEAVVTAPTCTEKGYTTYTCSVCGYSYRADETEAKGHTWGEGVVTTAPTCTETGVMTYTCEVCGENKTETIPAKGHDWQVTFKWSTDYSTCTAVFTCQNDFNHLENVPCVVTSDPPTRDATCTTDGETVYTANSTFDGNDYSDEQTVVIPATGHNYLAVVTAPTCTDGGYTTYTCTVCGDSYVADETDATGHTKGEAVIENSVAATCTTDGSYDSVVYCSVCGEEISRETVTVPATGHDYVATTTIDPTCTTGGYTTYTCTRCGDSYTANETEATGHTTEIQNAKDATCTEDGYTGDEVCTVCGETVQSGEVIPATGHSWDDGAVTKAATCTEAGEMTYTCMDCGDTYAEAIAATGHTAGTAVEENNVDAACTTNGSYDSVVYCSVCGEEISRETVTVPATGHDYVAVVTAPTCTEKGYTTYTCSVCGDSYVADETAATGHSWDDGVVTTEPTATTDGVMTYTCTVCGETYTEAIAATGEVETVNNISISELTEVPEGLSGIYSSVTELTNDLTARVVSVSAGYSEENTVVYDVKLQFSRDGGITWEDATEENFPAEGITVTLSYPNDEIKANYENYDFVVLHMFTSGEKAGQTETPAVTKTADGIVVTLTGFSPVAVAWKASAAASPQTGNDSIIQFGIVAILSGGASLICVGIAIRKRKQRKSA